MYAGTNGRMSMDRLGGIDWERMRAYRLKRTKEAMEKFGIDVLITWDAYRFVIFVEVIRRFHAVTVRHSLLCYQKTVSRTHF